VWTLNLPIILFFLNLFQFSLFFSLVNWQKLSRFHFIRETVKTAINSRFYTFFLNFFGTFTIFIFMFFIFFIRWRRKLNLTFLLKTLKFSIFLNLFTHFLEHRRSGFLKFRHFLVKFDPL
jgi:hypothetical protein